MIIQNILFQNKFKENINLYYRKKADWDSEKNYSINETHIHLSNSQISTDTYMNLFDAKTWEKYTGNSEWKFRCDVKGNGTIELISSKKDNNSLLGKIDCREDIFSTKEIPIQEDAEYIYLNINAKDCFEIKNACFLNGRSKWEKREVALGVIICTYKRKEELKRNIDTLYHTKFFDRQSDLYHKMEIHIVDNASEILKDKLPYDPFIFLHYNPNTGGSGGFERGMKELRKRTVENSLTHVVLMDDDVEFIPETFYRIYALLKLMKSEYCQESIAGRMFRTDVRHVQYTAVEIWNKGNLQHIGFMQDMTDSSFLSEVNCNTGGEYGGWWLCCYPMEFVKNNNPVPFFLHCDDVEYGLRHKGVPIILNGIQVWHETYEYRKSPIILYYDTRNTLYVNEKYCLQDNKEEILKEWKKRITELHLAEKYIEEYMVILGFLDYCKGFKWLRKHNTLKKHKKICRIKDNHMKRAILWRYAQWKFIHKYLKK